MANIAEAQNDPENLQLLKAQRYRYGQAKRLAAVQALLAGTTPLVAAAVVSIDPTKRVWAALAGIVVSLVDGGLLDPYQRRLREVGASIQERFDCAVLGLPWNEPVCGARPDHEDVHEAASSYSDRASAPLENWYPTAVSALPLFEARLICQRTSCWWDSKLRRRYAGWIIAAVALVSVFVVVAGIVQRFSLEAFVLAVVTPLSPTLLWAMREVRRQRSAATALDRLKDYGHSLWGRVVKRELSETDATALSRELQDAIFYRRRENPFVFDWIYRRLRNSYEEQMNVNADQMVREVPASRS